MRRFELNLANAVLFDNLSLDGFDEILPGRLFTTRMPRKIHEDPAAAERFKAKVAQNRLDTVLILTESKEYEQYAGADLEAFYRSLGLEIIHRPIVDFSLPDYPMIVADIEDLTLRLAEGKHCLVHCAGGSGRTGMVVASVIKNVGVQDPVAWVRRVKTTYVETPEQEHFVRSLPPVLSPEIAARSRGLARAVAAEQLVDTVIRGAKTAVQVAPAPPSARAARPRRPCRGPPCRGPPWQEPQALRMPQPCAPRGARRRGRSEYSAGPARAPWRRLAGRARRDAEKGGEGGSRRRRSSREGGGGVD